MILLKFKLTHNSYRVCKLRKRDQSLQVSNQKYACEWNYENGHVYSDVQFQEIGVNKVFYVGGYKHNIHTANP